MINQIKELIKTITGKTICISGGLGYVSIEKTYTAYYGECGISIFNENNIMDTNGDIISINIRDIVSIDELEVQGDKEFWIEDLKGVSYTVSVVCNPRKS